MDKLVAQYSRPPHQNEMYSEQEQQDLTASVPPLSLKFSLPPVDNRSAFLRAMTDDHSNPSCPIKLAHGTTTLAFRFQGGIVRFPTFRLYHGSFDSGKCMLIDVMG
jgi:20S proteasome subunit beta 5